MRKLFYSLVVLAVVSIFTSCTPKPEELIIGTWNLSDVEIKNMDEYAQSMIDMQMPFVEMQFQQINDQIAAIEEEVKTLKDKAEIDAKQAELDALKSQLAEAQKQKDELTVDRVKEEFKKNFDEMKSEFKMIFKEDKTYENVLEGAKGSWTISEDGKTLTTTDDAGQAEDIAIEEISADKMVLLLTNAQGDMTIEMTMSFTKGEVKVEAEAEVEKTEEAAN